MANEANQPNPAPPAPAAAAPQAPAPDSPPAPAPAVAPTEPAAAPVQEAAAPAVEAKAPEAQLTLLQQFDKDNSAKPAEAKPEGDKPAGDPVKPEGEGDKPKPDGDKPAEPKPGEAKPAEAKPGDKPAEAKPAEAPKVEPVAYEYALPETIKMDDALKGEFHTALDGFRADPAKGAQGLIALHERTMTEYATALQTQMAQHQRDVWNDTRKAWNTDVLASEEIGGSGHQTAMAAIARMRDLFVPETKRAAFEQFLEVTGAGDHPAFLEMLHQAARMFDEPPMPPPNVKPSPTNGQNPNARRGIIYDHPRSNVNRSQ